ncbi:glycosyltransferase family 2 protein [soil metagenome]
MQANDLYQWSRMYDAVVPSSQPTVSAIVIAHNEAHQIRECLATLAWCDEIVVVDSGSTDATAAIAAECGARVTVTHDWPGFGLQKQRALDGARCDWIVSLDADERMTPAGIAELKQALLSADASGYRLSRRSWFLTRFIRHSGWWPDEVLRVSLRSKAHFTGHVVHERLEVDGTVRSLREPIEHFSYPDRATVRRKIDEYSAAGAQELARRGKPGGLSTALVHAAWSFLRTYLFRLGVLDGWAGLELAAMNARTSYWKYIRLGRMKP